VPLQKHGPLVPRCNQYSAASGRELQQREARSLEHGIKLTRFTVCRKQAHDIKNNGDWKYETQGTCCLCHVGINFVCNGVCRYRQILPATGQCVCVVVLTGTGFPSPRLFSSEVKAAKVSLNSRNRENIFVRPSIRKFSSPRLFTSAR
jgi:hypothetical protein